MTNDNYTHIAVVLDRSGSMISIKKDMEGGLNSFFAEQAELEGTCLVDLAQFDNTYEIVFLDRPVGKAYAKLEPRGSTALLDAIGRTINELGTRLAALSEDERPGKVQVIVVTDGYENASCEFNREVIRELIKRQTNDYSWDFVFMGTNFDAVAVGTDYGFDPNKSLTFSPVNVSTATSSLSNYTTTYRGSAGSAAKFSEDDRVANS